MAFAIHRYESAIGAHVSPHPEPPSHLPPHPIPLGCPRALALGALLHASNSHCSSILHMVMHMFQCYSIKSSYNGTLLSYKKEHIWDNCYCCCLVTKSCLTLLWPHGLQPIRLLSPWDFSGKNSGASWHFLLQGIFLTQGSNPGVPHCRQILTAWTTREAHFFNYESH